MYSFAITVPACTETPLEDQLEFWNVLKSRYSCSFKVPRFGQGSTTLMVLERKDSAVKEADDR
jgi:hypothetical protein